MALVSITGEDSYTVSGSLRPHDRSALQEIVWATFSLVPNDNVPPRLVQDAPTGIQDSKQTAQHPSTIVEDCETAALSLYPPRIPIRVLTTMSEFFYIH